MKSGFRAQFTLANDKAYSYLLGWVQSPALASFGQAGRGSISGTVTDQSGAMFPGSPTLA